MRAQRRRPRGRPQRQGLRRCFRRPRVTKGRGWDAASPAAFRGDTALSIQDGWLPELRENTRTLLAASWCVVRGDGTLRTPGRQPHACEVPWEPWPLLVPAVRSWVPLSCGGKASGARGSAPSRQTSPRTLG